MNATIGQPVRRREDIRFITGRGRYTDDISAPGQTFAVFVRSPHAGRRSDHRHGRREGDARRGGRLYRRGPDRRWHRSLPCGWLVKSTDGSDMKVAPRPPLASRSVNFVGEPYAV